MHALVVLALGVKDLNGLGLIDQHAAVAYLSTHLAIERGVVQHELIVLVLLLRHLAVAQDAALILRIVVAHELLFCLSCRTAEYTDPVAVLYGSSIAGTLLLFLHLYIELLFVH